MFQSLKTFFVVSTLAMVSVHAHWFNFVNKCNYGLQPRIENVNCGYSPRCNQPGSGGVPSPAISYSGGQPSWLNPGQSTGIWVNNQWNGRIFAQNGGCGPKGEGCTMAEFNLDSGSYWTPQSYDISNIQGFTQSMQINVDGCDSVTCTWVGCSCRDAYPPGDLSGCGNDSPVRACGAGDKTFTVVFCP